MNARRKLLLVAFAGVVVLAGGAFAWKNGKGSGLTRPRVPEGQTFTAEPGGKGVNP